MNPKTLKMILIISLLVFHYFLLVLTVSKGLLITKIAIIRLLLQLKDEALSTTPLLGILLNQIAILGNVDLTTKTLDENSSYQATANKNPLSRTHLQLSTRSFPIFRSRSKPFSIPPPPRRFYSDSEIRHRIPTIPNFAPLITNNYKPLNTVSMETASRARSSSADLISTSLYQ